MILIRGLLTADETQDFAEELVKTLDKVSTPSGDMPGFIANRILTPYINEAIYCLQDGVGTAEEIDKTLVLNTNVSLGPLATADFVGLDTVLRIMRILHSDLGDPKYRPCPLLIKYVDAGWLGKKTDRGFYKYRSYAHKSDGLHR